MAVQAQTTTETDDTNELQIAAEALLYAADCFEQIVEKETVPVGGRYGWRRGHQAAHSHNLESATTAENFDAVEAIYSEVLLDVMEREELADMDAVGAIRTRGQNLLDVA